MAHSETTGSPTAGESLGSACVACNPCVNFRNLALRGRWVIGGPEGIRTPDPLVANRKTKFTKSCQNQRQPRGISKLGKNAPRLFCLDLHQICCTLAHFSAMSITFLSQCSETCESCPVNVFPESCGKLLGRRRGLGPARRNGNCVSNGARLAASRIEINSEPPCARIDLPPSLESLESLDNEHAH